MLKYSTKHNDVIELIKGIDYKDNESLATACINAGIDYKVRKDDLEWDSISFCFNVKWTKVFPE